MLSKRRLKLNIKEKIIMHLLENKYEYAIITIIFIIGIVLSTIYVTNMSEVQKNEISMYVNNFLNRIQENAKIDYMQLLKRSLINNSLILILIGISGLTVIGIPILYLIIIIKGFSIGFTISSIIGAIGKIDGIKFVFSALFLQNMIQIPCILFLSVYAIKLYKTIVKERRRDNIKFQILKYIIILITVILLSIISSFIETYISSNFFMLIFT